MSRKGKLQKHEQSTISIFENKNVFAALENLERYTPNWDKTSTWEVEYQIIFIFIFFFWPCLASCGILVPRPGIEPAPPALETRSPNHRTTREFPVFIFFISAF